MEETNIEPTPTPTPTLPQLPGLNPIWSAIAQLGAVGLMGVMFWQSQSAWFVQVKEDRQLVVRESDRMWQAIRDNQKSLEDLARGVKDDQNTARELMIAIKELTSEVKKNTAKPNS